jgi:hypothetical protein
MRNSVEQTSRAGSAKQHGPMQVADHSFAIFVYPFCFDRASFNALVGAADRDVLATTGSSWRIWDRRTFPRDDLLPHVADYLNPPLEVPATACLWTLEHRVLTSPQGLGLSPGSASLNLRHRMGSAESKRMGLLPAGALGFDVGGIDLSLFRVGMGYLTLRVKLHSSAPEDWYDFLNGFRFIDRPGQVDWLIRRRTGPDSVVAFVPPLVNAPGGVPDGPIQGRHLIGGVLRRLLDLGADWWREIFVPGQMLPFHALFFTRAPETEHPLVLYRLRNFFRAGQALVPAANDLRPDHPTLLSYAEQMWFSTTLEGGGFVAFDAPDTNFWSETMPVHLREQYFLLFLFALHQRFSLMHLSDQVCARWLGDDVVRAEARFAELREALLEFTARGHFTQIMQREHHHRCFRAWREVFETERLYREVRDEVRELHSILLMRKTERIQQLAEEQRRLIEAQARAEAQREKGAQARSDRLGLWFGAVAFLFGFPSLVLSYLDVVPTKPGLLVIWGVIGGSLLIGSLMLLGLHSWLMRHARLRYTSSATESNET